MTLLKKPRTNGENYPSVLSNLVEDFFTESIPSWTGYSTSPRVNIRERSKEFNIELAVPGFTKKDFNIELDDNLLTISAKHDEVIEEENEGYTRREFDYASFSRSFTLPESVKPDSIKCSYDNGMLNVTVPKREGTQELKKSFTVS